MAAQSCQTWSHCRMILVVLWAVILVSHAQTETNEVIDTADKKLEDTVFTDMLRIVDHKFDTLTTRITSLERAVSNLQFFSIRQFRQLSGSIQSTENDLEDVSRQVGQLDVSGRALKIAMTLLGRDMTELKSTTNDMLSELEASVVYINDNVEKQTEQMKGVVDVAVHKHAKIVTSRVGELLEEVLSKKKTQPESVNCTVDFSALNERIDLRFAQLKRGTDSHFVRLFNAAQPDDSDEELKEGAETDKEGPAEEKIALPELENSKSKQIDTNKSSASFIGSVSAQEHVGHVETKAEKVNSPYRLSDQYNESYYEQNDERIMKVLTNMTVSVLQAVSYFRHSGRMLERIMTNSDSLLASQSELLRKVDGLQSPASPKIKEAIDVEISNVLPGSQPQGDELQSFGSQAQDRGPCMMAAGVSNTFASMAKNGSQLLEVLTDLAQMSSMSLTQTTSSLRDEIKKVEALKTSMATALLSRPVGSRSGDITQLKNVTNRTYKLLESVASKTSHLPPILRKVQHVATLSNISLQYVTRNSDLIKDLQHMSNGGRAKTGGGPADTISNVIPGIAASQADEHTSAAQGPDKFFSLDRDTIETIYSTSLQLNRIMPALTKLLAEPVHHLKQHLGNPLFTLVGSGRANRGRLEVYNKGQWGTICHRNLTHREADAICLHLGFTGGISAGSGYFGPGTGISWSFNSTCLETHVCPAIVDTGSDLACSHELDAGVICDHMLRIQSRSKSHKIKAGRIEIHHRGVWLPVCGEGWSGYSARVACRQLGFKDGREAVADYLSDGRDTKWVNRVVCTGTETRLDACKIDSWSGSCPWHAPAGVRCL